MPHILCALRLLRPDYFVGAVFIGAARGSVARFRTRLRLDVVFRGRVLRGRGFRDRRRGPCFRGRGLTSGFADAVASTTAAPGESGFHGGSGGFHAPASPAVRVPRRWGFHGWWRWHGMAVEAPRGGGHVTRLELSNKRRTAASNACRSVFHLCGSFSCSMKQCNHRSPWTARGKHVFHDRENARADSAIAPNFYAIHS